mmetsp:Transcript_2987/g.9036  ORF Transcript_2987/g.9036 Transcript_2987/m.9036 type:complete len:90 (+) Transcript_2987:1551-1820(+)
MKGASFDVKLDTKHQMRLLVQSCSLPEVMNKNIQRQGLHYYSLLFGSVVIDKAIQEYCAELRQYNADFAFRATYVTSNQSSLMDKGSSK